MRQVTILQRFVFPDASRADRLPLYARWLRGDPVLANSLGTLQLTADTWVDFGTFFNAFSLAKWRQLTAVETLFLCVAGSGTLVVRILAVSKTGAARPIAMHTLELDHGAVKDLPVGSLPELPGELLSIQVTAVGDNAEIASAAWTTFCTPRREVSLAAVMVTFRRESAAQHAIARFAEVTIPQSPHLIRLIVIDNGQTLHPTSTSGVTVISNPNLGGAGGFARGLIAAREAGIFTHALFMDDDASCEPESVWRTAVLSAYLTDPRASVAGAMLTVDRPTVQYEKGGHLNVREAKGAWHPLQGGVRLAEVAEVAHNDGVDAANYGAWWFFAFPLSAVESMPFPFFVRGDDADFSVVNRLPIVTLNGVASWCENFGHKLSAKTEYLTYRSWLVLALLHGDRGSAARNLREVCRHALTFAFRFDYACMAAITDAIEDVGRGPDFFADHPAPIARLQAVADREDRERIGEADFARLVEIKPELSMWRLLLGVVSLGGHLVPATLLSEAIPHVHVAWEAGRFRLLGFKAVAVGTGEEIAVFRRDTAGMLVALRRLLKVAWRVWRALPSLEARFKAAGTAVRTEAYWRRQLAMDRAGQDQRLAPDAATVRP